MNTLLTEEMSSWSCTVIGAPSRVVPIAVVHWKPDRERANPDDERRCTSSLSRKLATRRSKVDAVDSDGRWRRRARRRRRELLGHELRERRLLRRQARAVHRGAAACWLRRLRVHGASASATTTAITSPAVPMPTKVMACRDGSGTGAIAGRRRAARSSTHPTTAVTAMMPSTTSTG